MLTVFVATFVIFALVILGMSLGYSAKVSRAAAAVSHRWGLRRSATARSRAMRVKSASRAKRSASKIGSSDLSVGPASLRRRALLPDGASLSALQTPLLIPCIITVYLTSNR